MIYTSSQFVKTAKLEDLLVKLKQEGLTVVYLESFRKTISLREKIAGIMKGLVPSLSYKVISGCMGADKTAVVLFTSGSEGAPKGVALSHKNILANVYQMASRVDFSHRDLIFNVLPIFHCFGLTAGSILPLVTGNRCFFYPSPLHYKIIPGLVYDTNATIMFGTDTFLTGYARYAEPNDFNTIRYIFAGAEKVKTETIQHWAKTFGARILEGYGATEAAPVIALNSPMVNKTATVGQIMPKIEYQIKPVEGIKEGGKLIIKGPNVMQGYLRADNPGEIEHLTSGWYDTGDVVTVDEQGFITIVGRAKRFAKLGGEMVSLTAVESIASKLWPETLVAAISKADKKKGEQIILLTEYEEASRSDFVNYVRANCMSELYIPKFIKHIKQMPVLASGKINYVALNDLVAS